jgi:hypothetical protein
MKALYNPNQFQVGGRSDREISILDAGRSVSVAVNLNLKPKALNELLGTLLESQPNRELASILKAPAGE